MTEAEDARMAAIGRAVVNHLMPDNERAVREATPERVVEWLKRTEGELRSLQSCDALRVGRSVMDIAHVLKVRS